MRKKTISIDLDGVLNTYAGDYKEGYIAPIKEGVYEFLEKLSTGFDIEIFTVRDSELTQKWLRENDLDKFVIRVTNMKNPFSSVMLDDRALNFDGDFEKSYQQIVNFKPYWKK